MPVDDDASSPSTQAATTVSTLGIYRLRSEIRSSAASNIIAAVGFGAGVLITLYTTWFYVAVSGLARQYGWGSIPPDQYPLPPESIEDTFEVLGWVQIGGFIFGGIAALYSLSKIRSGIEAVLGKPAFYYTWRWTIITLFVPIVGLYRPWVGFGELRRAVMGIVSRNRISLEWKTDGARADTLIFGATFIGASIGFKILEARAEAVAANPNFNLGSVEAFVQLTTIETIVRMVLFLVVVWYLRSLTAASRKVAEIADTSETFA